jgi:hypothetical protein
MRNILMAVCTLALVHTASAEWRKHVIEPEDAANGMVNTAVAADFDNDGAIDVMASFAGKVVVYKGPDWKKRVTAYQFPSKNRKRPPRWGCIHSTLLDVNRDGRPDLVGSAQLVFWLECPDKPFNEPWPYRLIDDKIKGTHCLITGDVDGDGRLDLIANSFQTPDKTPFPNSITWQKVPTDVSTGGQWRRNVFADGDAPGGNHYMGFGDVNGDGRADIACGAKGGPGFDGGQWFAWWEQPADGSLPWLKHILADNEPGASNIIPADVNGDGRPDYVASRGHGKGILWFKSSPGKRQGAVNFELIDIDPEFETPHSLDVADIDDDGDMDIASCGSLLTGVAAWYQNDGKGNFTKHVVGRDQSSYDTRLIDLDNDGDLDMLIAGHFSKNLVWYENPLR